MGLLPKTLRAETLKPEPLCCAAALSSSTTAVYDLAAANSITPECLKGCKGGSAVSA